MEIDHTAIIGFGIEGDEYDIINNFKFQCNNCDIIELFDESIFSNNYELTTYGSSFSGNTQLVLIINDILDSGIEMGFTKLIQFRTFLDDNEFADEKIELISEIHT